MELDFIDISGPNASERRVRNERKRPVRAEDRKQSGSQQGKRPKKLQTDMLPQPERSRRADLVRQRERIKRQQKRRRKRRLIRASLTAALCLLMGAFFFFLFKSVTVLMEKNKITDVFSNADSSFGKEASVPKPDFAEDFLTVNPYSRPGEKLEHVRNIFVHYTANPGTSAAQNRSYFENLGITGETSASAHFVIGYEGEIIQCLPLDEIGYAVKERNYDSVSIECCYLKEDGSFTEETYEALIQLSAWLLQEYGLSPEDMRRHYDEGGKKCPLYYVENEGAWLQFLEDLKEYM